jgi:hypothetical protein
MQQAAGAFARRRVGCERLGDAEVEEFRFAVGRDEDVRRLDVAVHDEIPVRVLHGVGDLDDERDALAHAEPARVAPAVDRLALDIFHREIRRVVVGDAAVVQRGDVRVRKARERFALAQEPALHVGIRELAADQLQRNAMLELPVGALGKEHAAHAAGADFAQQEVGADACAGGWAGRLAARCRECRRDHASAAVEEIAARAGMRREQRAELVERLGLACALCGEPAFALGRGHVERGGKQRLDARPVRARAHGGVASSSRRRNARARSQSRRTVRSWRCIASAISSNVRPAKKCHSTSRARSASRTSSARSADRRRASARRACARAR